MKKLIYSLMILLLSSNLFAFNGDGSMATPYQIGDLADLQQLASDVNGETPNSYAGFYFELTQDIDLSSIINWTPIGIDVIHKFQGIIDGKGHIITGISITGTADNVGLFGFIKSAQIKNLGVSGSISGSNNIAAIVADAINSSISNCYSSATVTATGDYAGGIVGVVYNTTITNCYNKGAIIANSGAGGIIGLAYNPEEIYNVHATNLNGIISIKAGYEKLAYHYIPSKIGTFNINRLYDNLFQNNLYIQEIEIASGNLTNFHTNVLYGCSNLKKVTINPTSGKNVGFGTSCFYNCTGLKGVFTIPDCVNALGAAVMTGCSNITELHISSNISTIPRSFLGMTKLTKLYLPRTSLVTLTDAAAFNVNAAGSMTIYVPTSLVDTYKTATNWSKWASTIVAIP